MTVNDTFDLIVIGAGWFGLIAAKTYIELHPKEKILIIEAESTCGGTWSKDRLYPGLKTNTPCGVFEIPDFALSEEVYGVKYGQHVPGEVVHRYLTDYAKHFGMFERTMFKTHVDAIESHPDGGWVIHAASVFEEDASSARNILRARKLLVATGLTSEPNIPSYPGQETFTPPFFHAKELCVRKDSIKSANKAVVIGAGKSAFDCAYAYATDESTQVVDMIIRPAGKGPRWLCPAYVSPLKIMIEGFVNTRFAALFTPCPWGIEDGFVRTRRFLHGTAIGRFLVEQFWRVLTFFVIKDQDYNHPALSKLKPFQPDMFWASSHEAINNFPTKFFDLVKSGKIRTHIADITKLDGARVHLSDGGILEADVVVCATGWKKESKIKFANFNTGLEMPREEKERLSEEADKAILRVFPVLKNQPVLKFSPQNDEPLRNYRFIVPADRVFDRNIAFAGMASTVSSGTIAAAQAIWISAYFDGKLKRAPKSKDEVIKEVMLHTQFGKWRYPLGYGANLPDICFDGLPYVDLLLHDLGLNSHRKGTRMKELMDICRPSDYNGLTQEWMDMQKK